jgi:protein gp37
MSTTTQIEWTDATWNPVTGCSKITRGCDFCYAERFSERFRGVAGHPFESGFDLTLRPERLSQPLRWRQPKRIFVNSMSDLFHKEVPRSFIDSVFETMELADWHTFQVLTKRSSLMVRYLRNRYGETSAPPHIWLGVSVEDAKNAVRLKHLQSAQATVRFVSFEPLLGPVGKIDLTRIDWAIVGGESGPRARPMGNKNRELQRHFLYDCDFRTPRRADAICAEGDPTTRSLFLFRKERRRICAASGSGPPVS